MQSEIFESRQASAVTIISCGTIDAEAILTCMQRYVFIDAST